MANTKTIELFKCLSDKSRLDILKSLSQEAMYVEQLSQRLNLTPSTVSFHLKKLENCGLVQSQKEQYYTIYSIALERLRQPILELVQEKDSNDSVLDEREQEYRKKVLQSFFKYGKLVSIPVQRKKRDICLEEIVKLFEPNRQYTEKEVNLIIADVNDDFCTLRRELIMTKRLERKDSLYWRKES